MNWYREQFRAIKGKRETIEAGENTAGTSMSKKQEAIEGRVSSPHPLPIRAYMYP